MKDSTRMIFIVVPSSHIQQTSWFAHFDRVAAIEIIAEFISSENTKIVMQLGLEIGQNKGTVA
jgi:hypothetical protein